MLLVSRTWDETRRIRTIDQESLLRVGFSAGGVALETELTDANFKEEVLQSELPVLVDFWAPWCAPCHMVSPVVEEIAGDYAGKLKVGKLNVDEAQSIAVEYGVMNIPTIALFKNGELVERIVGAVPKAQLEAKIKPHITAVSG